jgi:peroxidase
MAIRCFLLPLSLLLLAASSALAQLEIGYYRKSCPAVEAIVREEMVKIIAAAPSLAGPLLRLHFHDCFVRVSVHALNNILAPAFRSSECKHLPVLIQRE